MAVEHGWAKERNYPFYCWLYEQKYPEIRQYEISTWGRNSPPDSFVSKLIEDGNSDEIISDSIRCLSLYEPFTPEKGKSYDGLSFRAAYGVRGY
jgi:hypothetical protein